MDNKIKISYRELQDAKVDEILAQESSFRRGMGSKREVEGLAKVSFIHKSWFYLMVAGFVGALIAWALIEPNFSDAEVTTTKEDFFAYILFPTVGGMIGLMIGAVEGILSRNYPRAFKAGMYGLGVGLGGGVVSAFVGGIALVFVALVAWGMLEVGEPNESFAGFIAWLIARSSAWMISGMTVALGPGIALKSKKLQFNGFLGGMIGGLIGGLVFDPINYVVSGGTLETGAGLSRAIGLAIIGGTAGLMFGIVEMLSKDAWLLMTEGPLKGKQFVVYKNPTQIGSSPHCEIYLFKDPSIEPYHAEIHIVRDGYIIEDKKTPEGTLVNGQKISRKLLQNGDEIQIGRAKFTYSEKEKKPS